MTTRPSPSQAGESRAALLAAALTAAMSAKLCERLARAGCGRDSFFVDEKWLRSACASGNDCCVVHARRLAGESVPEERARLVEVLQGELANRHCQAVGILCAHPCAREAAVGFPQAAAAAAIPEPSWNGTRTL